jgi:hypothetical protein
MRVLHPLPTLSALTEPVAVIFKPFGAAAQSKPAQAAPVCIALAVALLLGGCSGMRIIDSDVSAFSTLPAAPVSASYRFERLPSQQVSAERQAKVEAMAESALAKAGLKRVDAPAAGAAAQAPAAAQYSVLIGARTQQLDGAPWEDVRLLPGRDYVVTGHGRMIFTRPFPGMRSPYYVREVSMLVRDLVSGSVVFESHAKHEDRWNDGDAIVPVMFEAALQGYPAPPAGVRRVNIEIAR